MTFEYPYRIWAQRNRTFTDAFIVRTGADPTDDDSEVHSTVIQVYADTPEQADGYAMRNCRMLYPAEPVVHNGKWTDLRSFWGHQMMRLYALDDDVGDSE